MSLSASDVSDAVLDGLRKLTGHDNGADSLEQLLRWQVRSALLPETIIERLIDFAIYVAETETARTMEASEIIVFEDPDLKVRLAEWDRKGR
jgi:hypothetical protein